MALAKLGEVMNDVDWRTQRRLAGVPSRPPPSRPDRGYVEQPEERVEPTVVSKRGLIPMQALEREQLADLEEELAALEAPLPPPVESQLTLQPQPETQPSQPPATEPAEMPKARKERTFHTPEVMAAAVERVLTGPKGTQSKVAHELGVNPGTVSLWVTTHKARHGQRLPSESKTLMSSPQSGPVSVNNGVMPPVPTVSIPGLEEYIRAIVAQEMRAHLRKAFGGE
jgi:transposase-like protein